MESTEVKNIGIPRRVRAGAWDCFITYLHGWVDYDNRYNVFLDYNAISSHILVGFERSFGHVIYHVRFFTLCYVSLPCL